jgi:hypothetical protein
MRSHFSWACATPSDEGASAAHLLRVVPVEALLAAVAAMRVQELHQ